MATLEQLSSALLKADAAGDTSAATTLANAIRSMRQTQKAPDPSEGGGTLSFGPIDTGVKTPQWLDRGLAGVGKSITDLGQGVSQTFGGASREDVAEKRKIDSALNATTGGKVGQLLGGAAMLAPTAFLPGANTVTGAGVIGSLTGLMQPSESTSETVGNVLLGGGTGMAGQFAANKIGTALAGKSNMAPNSATVTTTASGAANATAKGGGSGFGSVGDDVARLSSSMDSIQKTGRELGFKTTPGQKSGSRALQQMEAKLESQPMTSGPFNSLKDNNQRVLNRIAAKSIGENSDVVDTAVLNAAHDRIGGVYKMVATDTPAVIDPDKFLSKLQTIEGEYEGLLPVAIQDNPLVKRLWTYAENGTATNRQLQDLASKLNKASHNQMTSSSGDRQVGMALSEIKGIADDLLESNLTGDTLKQFQKARGEYKNLMTLTQRQGVVNPATGNVQGGSLASALQQKDKSGYLFGKNNSDLYNAARFAQAHKPIVGDSGTATRSMVTNPMEIVASLPMNIATSAYLSTPSQSLFSGYMNGLLSSPTGKEIGRNLGRLGTSGGIGLGLLANPE